MLTVTRVGATLAVAAIFSFLLGHATAQAAAGAGNGACSVPAGAHAVASVAGVRVWSESVPTPAPARRQYGAGSTYPRYAGCVAGHQPYVLFRDYPSDGVVVRVAGHYVGLLDRGGSESLYLSNLVAGRTVSTRSYTPSVQDNGGSEANEPGPLITWRVAPSGWLVYLDTLADSEGFGTALVAFGDSGATTLDLAPVTTPREISGLVVRGKTVSWRSRFSGTHRVTLGRALLPADLPRPLPSACRLVPRSLARRLLGPLSATPPPPPRVPPAGFWPHVRTGTNPSSCAYAAAADTTQTVEVTVQRVTAAIVSRQRQAINNTPRADSALVLPGNAAMLFDSRFAFSPSGPEDLRMFIHGVEVDVTTNYGRTNDSNAAAREIEVAGLAIERALHDVPPAGAHG